MQDQCVLQQMEEALRIEYQEYENILALSETQFNLLQEPDPDVARIASIMDQKMSIMDSVREIELSHKPVKEKWGTVYSLFNADDKQKIVLLKEKLMTILMNLKDLEDQIADSIRKCESAIALQLKAIYQGRYVNQAYFKINQGSSRYIDKKK